jgi:dihydrofolate reductase
MPDLICQITMSLDGFVAGPDVDREHGLGRGGERLHAWLYDLEVFHRFHGRSGGITNASSAVVEEAMGAPGAIIMGRGMFGGGDGPWGDPAWGDAPWEGWWGDEPPFGVPVFVLTHHAREPLTKGRTTFTFVTDGIGSALEQARAAAGDKAVAIAGGASVVQQYLAAGLLDEIEIHVAPVLIGDGARLFDHRGSEHIELECTRVIPSDGVTHLRYRVLR